ncbi:MAG: response regulator [Cyclobacteriaceae bacterium]|nr:response regulator [Cyclobacteriaceae bacterium]
MEEEVATKIEKPKKEFSILYVDDEAPNLRGFKTSFRRIFNVHIALSGVEAMEIIRNEKIDIIVSDHRMPEMNGTDLLKEVYEYNPNIRRMILSGFIKRHELKEAVDSFGIHDFVTKPWDMDNLLAIFNRLLEPDPKLMTFD